jgi:hypothetical protein
MVVSPFFFIQPRKLMVKDDLKLAGIYIFATAYERSNLEIVRSVAPASTISVTEVSVIVESCGRAGSPVRVSRHRAGGSLRKI